jgi:hypothetical protein
VALSDTHSHFFPGEYDLSLDLDKSIGYLMRGLALPALDADERGVLEDRLADVRGRQARRAKGDS